MIHNYSSSEATDSGNCSNADCTSPLVFAEPTSGSQLSFPTYAVLSSDVPDATIRYTTDGTEPDSLSTIYTGPVLIASAGVVLRAIAHTGDCDPGPIASIQYINTSFPLVFSYACDTPDKGGQWDDFAPNGVNDHHWQLQFTLAGAQTIKRLELYQLDASGNWTTGQVWSTDSPINPVELADEFEVFPLLLFIAAVQQHTDYQSSLGSFGAGTHTWDLYGDTVIAAGGLFRIDIILGDDTKLSQTITGATCVATPPICPPPAAPTVTGKCDGAVDVTFAGTVGRNYIIYFKSDICLPGEGWQEGASGSIDVSPKTVELSGLTHGCLYEFYVSVDEAGCGFRDSSPASATPLFDAIVSIATNKTIVDPNESFTISWNSQHIGTAVCGGCLAGQVSINQSMGCKAGNVAGSQSQSQAVCGIYTYQITGCNACGTVIASVQVEVRCPAACSGTQPFRVLLSGAQTFLCSNYGSCATGFYQSELLWDGQMYPTGFPCNYSSPTSGGAQKLLSGCIENLGTIWDGHILDATVRFVAAGPYYELVITGQRVDLASEDVWIGRKTVGNNPVGVYAKVGGCASNPATLTLIEVLAP